MKDDSLVTSTKVGNKSLTFLWDTGAPLSVVQPAAKISGEVRDCSKTVLFKLASNPKDCKAITTNVMMNGYDFGHVTFYVYNMPGLPADGIIGDDFFKNHLVYIDFSKRILTIK